MELHYLTTVSRLRLIRTRTIICVAKLAALGAANFAVNTKFEAVEKSLYFLEVCCTVESPSLKIQRYYTRKLPKFY